MNLTLGYTALLVEACRSYGLLRNQAAYVLATAYHETAHTMQPIRERGGEKYLRKKKYYPYVGMGFVQVTWLVNYQRAAKELDVDFVANPKLLLDPNHSAKIAVVGMKEGWFTGRRLEQYITLQKSDFRNARRIINGMDCADLIAGYAEVYDRLLRSAGYD